MATPLVTKKLKDDITRMAEAKEMFAIKHGDPKKKDEAWRLLKVLEKKWPLITGKY